MPSFKTTRRVNHSADKMFALIADVEKYPEFLPLCEALSIRDIRERDGKQMLVADMSVGYKAIRETFTSRVLLNPDESQIDVSYIDGPFKYLDNRWTFTDVDERSSDVHFYIDYEFKSKMLGMVMGSMFDRAFRMFAEAFEKRADEIYSES
ncbi:type II toxin-antitoxin system RatA family toxin [Ahrensia sp. 13_GOM-1096m]|uniref:type II toxin-antitoxin system RatA family toxin n=1 Tax=Ahrensia sp. 13_GOM-1096m TaxID=1380380 RepID=UPI00047DADB4|nr:type II toxin-antitoxin system RatA family toxin [Ahrensia sp. 13_GOM-1096m]